ncbi:LysR family transcriptional regulator [Paeniroseomonas aquatica]|uniref:LysR family transcriptional regulator n=1 Tax=Paeniroseomonas aquatica TaxID=373043 RepID=A0ABT8A8P6_9PROT|nr:LysR family transcriptional regulator [Paeniroseomonas aquatica]MDN3566013.1 LysR family transcriptional regulator [Paeniroseomonas aquatica]
MATIRLSVVLASEARIGPGKAALLESMRDSGPISAAARSMAMDYKRAWTRLDSMNTAFDTPVVVAVPGGTRGSGAQLTSFGIELLARYRRLEATVAALATDDLAAIAARALPESSPKV